MRVTGETIRTLHDSPVCLNQANPVVVLNAVPNCSLPRKEAVCNESNRCFLIPRVFGELVVVAKK